MTAFYTELAEILETIMLICFGFSWPINLVKNIKMRSAKNMSLPFLFLIWFGYVVGIAAKFIKLLTPELPNPTWYLMAIYIINFLMLTASLAVYFRNRKLDKLAEQK